MTPADDISKTVSGYDSATSICWQRATPPIAQ
jgi:hypothetical protein